MHHAPHRFLHLLGLAAMLALGGPPAAMARGSVRIANPIRQIPLSEEQVAHYLKARPAIDTLLRTVPPAAEPDPRLLPELNATARANGFADYANYESVAVNIIWILSGIDPLGKKYVGVAAVTKLELADLIAEKGLPPRERHAKFEVLHMQMLTAAPVKNAANVTLVTKFYDALIAVDPPEKSGPPP